MKQFILYWSILCLLTSCSFKENKAQSDLSNISTTSTEEEIIQPITNQKISNKPQIYDTLVRCADGISYNILIHKFPIKGEIFNGELDNKFHLLVKKEKDTLYNRNFDKNYFKINDTDFLKKATLYSLSFENIDCNSGTIKFFCGVVVPETDWSYVFEFYIDKNGNSKFFELDEEGIQKNRPDLH